MRSSKPGCSGSVRVNIEGFSHFEQGGRKLLEFFRRSAIVLTETSSRGQRLYPIAEESDDPIQSFGSARFAEISSFSISSARMWYSSASLRRLTCKTGSVLSRARRRHLSACSLKYDCSIPQLASETGSGEVVPGPLSTDRNSALHQGRSVKCGTEDTETFETNMVKTDQFHLFCKLRRPSSPI
jgi:hypothetical protein